jgi:hypothetical protein
VTVILPGFTVSVQSTHAPALSATAPALRPPSRLLALSVTVVLWPEASVPDVGDTVTCPISPDDSAMDQSTDPNDADRVSVPPFTPTTIVVGVTVRTPRLGGELEGAEVVLGAGELGFGLGFELGFGLGFALDFGLGLELALVGDAEVGAAECAL